MALQGAGDPRWVVRQREDGRNVNGWHWEDKDVSAWAKERLKQLICTDSCRTTVNTVDVVVDRLESVEGDATLYNRKGVLKTLYDVKISGKWTSLEEEEEERTYGDFTLELFDEDPEVLVTMDKKSKGSEMMRAGFSKEVVPLIRTQCGIFVKEIHSGAGLLLEGMTTVAQKKAEARTVLHDMRADREETGVRSDASKVELTLHDVFRCPTKDMFLALTDCARLEAITRGRAISEARVGGVINLLDGTVLGTYTKLVEGEAIEMNWKLKTWEDQEAGRALITISTEEGRTKVTVRITGVPRDQSSATEGFWRLKIFHAMKVVMGWGSASLFL